MATEQWPEAKCLQLIREFHKRPALWDKKNVFFYRQDIKQSAWLEISEVLQTDAEDCRRKMCILMSSFRREKAKIINNSTKTSIIESTWFGYKEMSFLLDKNSARKQIFMDSDEDDDIIENTDTTPAQHVDRKLVKIKRISSDIDDQNKSQYVIKMRKLDDNNDDEYVIEQHPQPESSEHWTETKSLQLIREFRSRALLWDQKNPLYYKKPLKQAAWREISEVLHSSAENCKRKMSILMSSFRREKAKILNSLKGNDSTGVVNSYWFGFKAMSFMLDKDSERERHAMGITYEEIEDQPPPVLHLNVKNINSLKATPVESIEESTTEIRRHISETEDSDASIPEQLCPTPSQSQHNEDELKYFTKFIISKMMKYSEATKNTVQQKICEIIFKADQNFYEPTQNCERHGDPLDSINEALPRSADISPTIKISYSDSE